MRHALRILPFALLLVLALGLVAPVMGQDSEAVVTTSDDGWITYAATSCDYGGEILSIEAVDATTVRFTLCRPDPAFPSKAAFSALGIHSAEHLEATGGGGEALVQHPIGTGPYRLENWDLGNEVVMTSFADYWGEPAKEPTLIFRWNSEAAARLTELQAGTVDGIDNPGPGDFDVIRNDSNLALYDRAGLNVMYLGFNNTYPPFDNQMVRQAIAHALDKQRIVDNFYPAGSIVADQFMPPALFGYTEEVEPFPYDPALAEQMLDEAGFPRGEDGIRFTTTLSYRDVVRGYLPQPGVVVQDIQAQLAAVGIEATIELQDPTTYLDNADRGQYPMYVLGWGADYPDATNFLDYHFGVGSSEQFGEKFTEITEPLSAGAALSDPAERYPFYVEANTALRDLVPMVPIAHGASAVAFKASVTGAHSSPLSNEQFAVMEDPDDDVLVWMQNGEPGGLYCADETDGESLRACEQINEALLGYEVAGTAVVPALASEYSANEEATEWTFTLRDGVTFHDGSTFDANDVVMSYAVQWDAAHPLHVGRDGNFTYFQAYFGAFLNAPEAE